MKNKTMQKPKERHRIYTDSQIRELTDKAAVRGFLHAVTLDACYHMEEEGYDCDGDKLAEHIETVIRWEHNRTNEHDLTIGKAKKLIKKLTGLTIDYD